MGHGHNVALFDRARGCSPNWAPGLALATLRWSLQETRAAIRNVGFRTATWLHNWQQQRREHHRREQRQQDGSVIKKAHPFSSSSGEIGSWLSLDTQLLLLQSACADLLGEGHLDLVASADTGREEGVTWLTYLVVAPAESASSIAQHCGPSHLQRP